MDRAIHFNEFKKMAADYLGIDINSITRDTSFIDDMGIDSLSLINFIILLEKKFNIKIEINNVWICKTIGEAYDLFCRKLEETGHPESSAKYLKNITKG